MPQAIDEIDYKLFIEENFKISDKNNAIIDFKLNNIQEQYLALLILYF